MTTVRELMETKVVSVITAAPIIEVARQMKVMSIGVIAVSDEGKFQGIITQRDLIDVLATAGEPLRESAGTIMNKNCTIISPNDDILRAADIMVEKRVQVLPVIDNGKLLGIFSLENLAGQSRGVAAVVFCKTIKHQTSMEDHLREYVSLAGTR
jgi:signal-transduction protein with cAMP-binding, CBS, and nucleotidyltransferase domain